MAAEFLDRRKRALGLTGAVAAHGLVLGALVLFAGRQSTAPAPREPGIVAIDLAEPPAPPPPAASPPDAAEEGAAPPSRGPTAEPAVSEPATPLSSAAPAEAAADTGTRSATGLGTAPGSGAGLGGEGVGRGSAGSGSGSGLVTPPVRIEGALTHADYRRARPPRGAAGTVRVEFRVRTDGRVDRCEVIGSSGVAVFDEATCQLIEQRFRFRPAQDAAGRAVDWTIRTEYTWTPG